MKQKNQLWLACVQHTVYTCINADVYATFESVCVFRARGPDKIEMGSLDTNENRWSRHLRVLMLQVLQSSASKTASRLPAEMVQLHRLLQPGLQISPTLFHYTETGNK